MSKMTDAVKKQREAEVKKPVENFMGGISYKYNPLDTLKMITASSIFGEPAYYRDGEFTSSVIKEKWYAVDKLFEEFDILPEELRGKKTSEIMEDAIDAALDHDFKSTLDWAVTLRHTYYMRLNPQVILVRAATHPKRAEFTRDNPGYFSKIQSEVMARPDEPASQLAYYLYKNKSKQGLPSILKRTWAKKLQSCSKKSLHKYQNTGIGMIDTVRICHAHSEYIDELMQNGSIEVTADNNTWEALRSQGMKWSDILSTVELGHMALLRNLRNIFTEIDDKTVAEALMTQLKAGVLNGKQFPFRYYIAYNMIEKDSYIHFRELILDTLETCMDISCENMPKLKGRTMCLSDNSGSAWGTFNSEYGSVTVAEIDNLSAVIAARNSDEGYVGKFGDKLRIFKIDHDKGILEQTRLITEDRGEDVGMQTEGGIWKFFSKAISDSDYYDNIFIFSDQQAGHGGLYGTDEDEKQYSEKYGCRNDCWRSCIDVAKLVDHYRSKVNGRVNVFSIQTAGYNNVVLPEYGYRTNLLYGWTGKEVIFADAMINLWNSFSSSTLV